MIRIFLRYIVEVEGLATKGFTKQQNNCYIKTLEVGVIVLYFRCMPKLILLIISCAIVGSNARLMSVFFPHCVHPRLRQAILYQLLPSLQRLVSVCFFAEGVNSLHASPSVSACTLFCMWWRLLSPSTVWYKALFI